MTILLDASGIIQAISGADGLFGSAAVDLRQSAFVNLVDPDQAASFEECLARSAARPGPAIPVHFDLVKPDGSHAELDAVLEHAGPRLAHLDAHEVTAHCRK